MNYFEKILELQKSNPRIGMLSLNSVNSDYTMYSADNKNCYVLVGSEKNEDCMYGNWVYESKDCTDCDFIFKCELCSESLDCENSYNCNSCQDCRSCIDCDFCYDCKGCENCFGCAGLRNKKFYIYNKPYSKEDYSSKKKEALGSDARHQFESLKEKTPRLALHAMNNENATGDYLYHSKNSFYCFDCKNLEDSLYMTSSIKCKDCSDCSNVYFGCELSFDVMSAIELYNCNYCNFCYYCRDIEYCENLYHCQNCFGSFYLSHKQFYIFNKPYEKEDYFKKIAEIKDSMRTDGTYGLSLPSTIKIEDSAIKNYWRT